MKRKYIKKLSNIFVILIGCMLGLVIIELSLRGFGYYLTNWNRFTYIKTKQPDELRILTLGESMTNSGSNPYPQQLQKILSTNPKINKKINVINGGIPGTASIDIVNNIEIYLDQYNPDIVVVMTGVNNDRIVEYDQWANIKNDDKINELKTIKLIKYFYQNLKNKLRIIVKNIYIPKAYANETDVDNIIKKIGEMYSNISIQEDGSETLTEKEIFKKLNNSTTDKDQVYIEFINYYTSIGDEEKQIASALKALSLNRNIAFPYRKLTDDYARILTFDEKEKLLLKALEVNPNEMLTYVHLGRLYSNNESLSHINTKETNKEKELQIYKKGIENNPFSVELLYWLGKYYYRNGNLEESKIVLNKAIGLNNIDNFNRTSEIYQILANIYQKQNRIEEANKVFGLAIESSDVLANNYPVIANILKNRGVKLIVMQYPLRDVNILKNILKDYDVAYVDNKNSFEKAVIKDGIDKIFVDLFAGDFGHCTPEGNKIMANNVAEVILNTYVIEN